MKSTGEVMGIDTAFGHAFAKSQTAAYGSLPTAGPDLRLGGQPGQARDDLPGQAAGRPRLRDRRHRRHRRGAAPARRRLRDRAASTSRTGRRARTRSSLIAAGEVALVINTPQGSGGARLDGYEIRSAAVAADIPCITTVPGRRGRGDGHRGADPGRDVGAPAAGAARRAARGAPGDGRRVLDRRRSRPVSVLYERLARPVLFRLGGGDAEAAHEWTLRRLARCRESPAALRALAALSRAGGAARRATVFGLRFPNPVGLAAGMDKDGVALPAWPALGFGFVEVGTVTRARRSRATTGPGCSGCRASRRRHQPDGLQQRRRARRWPPGWPRSAPLPVPLGHQPRQVEGDAAGRGGRRLPDLAAGAARRTATTSRSTSARRTRPGLRDAAGPRPTCASCSRALRPSDGVAGGRPAARW